MRASLGIICIGFPSAYCGDPAASMTENIKAYLDKGEGIAEAEFSKFLPTSTPTHSSADGSEHECFVVCCAWLCAAFRLAILPVSRFRVCSLSVAA